MSGLQIVFTFRFFSIMSPIEKARDLIFNYLDSLSNEEIESMFFEKGEEPEGDFPSFLKDYRIGASTNLTLQFSNPQLVQIPIIVKQSLADNARFF